MNVTGVIVEYNPLHNGHLYHLQQSIKQTKADLTIAVMSGDFLQRGEPALVSKWTRTKMALRVGIDLVIELPYAFATQKAEVFANGAISLLSALGATHVSFGSELGNIDSFIHTAQLFMDEDYRAHYNQQVKHFLSQGHSYPKAAALAYGTLNIKNTVDLSKPNNILGFHYVKAIIEQQSAIKPETILRTSAQYHDKNMSLGAISSATSIRKFLFQHEGKMDTIRQAIPKSTTDILIESNQSQCYANWDLFFRSLKYRVITSSTHELANIYEAEEGLEYRLKKLMPHADRFDDFMNLFKTKRYTWTRLQRLLTHVLTNTTKSDLQSTLLKPYANYIRLLGMSKKGQSYLNQNKKDFKLPLISNINQSERELLHLDIKAANTYDFLTDSNRQSEYQANPIRYDELKGEFL